MAESLDTMLGVSQADAPGAPGGVPQAGGTPGAAQLDGQALAPDTSPQAGASQPPSQVSPPPGPDGGPAPTTPQVAPTPVLEQFRQFGYDLTSDYPTDQAAVEALVNSYRQIRQQQQDPFLQAYHRYGPEGLRQILLQQQQAQAQQAAAQATPQNEQPPWVPPHNEAEVYQLVSEWYEKDPQTGRVRPTLGTPAEVVQKVQQYTDWKRAWQSSPDKLMTPWLESFQKKASDQALQQLRSELAQEREHQTAQQIYQQNQDWILQLDPRTKQPVRDAMGNPVFSPQGAVYRGYVMEAERMGVRSAQEQHQYAVRMVAYHELMNKYRAEQSPAANGVNGAARNAPSYAPAPAARGDDRHLDDREAMRREFAAAGITDEVLNQQIYNKLDGRLYG